MLVTVVVVKCLVIVGVERVKKTRGVGADV